jgi:hypothetical protein
MMFAIILLMSSLMAYGQNWSEGVSIPAGGRPNPYGLSSEDFNQTIERGTHHALYYPVTDTGIILPYKPIKKLIEGDSGNPLKKLISLALGVVSPFKTFDEMEEWLGLHSFPKNSPWRDPLQGDHRMGLTLINTRDGLGFTMSCTECHSENLFGHKVIGMTNRFARANDFFRRGIQVIPHVDDWFFQWATSATEGETLMFHNVKETVHFVEALKPQTLGLDTSLAQVALSLAKRAPDAFASKVPTKKRPDFLDTHVADSKPAVWWNVKYKNRWLSDGSVVSGNPIFTNIIWNEVGRGADLKVIEDWLASNAQVITELTTKVFSTKAPVITDFFPVSRIDEDAAKKGEALFNQTCARCHGVYEKNWSLPEADQMPKIERVKTRRVRYPSTTPVVNVGTDPSRYLGMRSLLPLNDLSISQANGIVIKPQKGYVPPPLVGIWARWPYFHNNAAPTLCDVLTAGPQRPVGYWARAAEDPQRDFDFDCNGYPRARSPQFSEAEYYYNSRKEGMSRLGHDEGIFLQNGKELFTSQEKRQIIQFLQTL